MTVVARMVLGLLLAPSPEPSADVPGPADAEQAPAPTPAPEGQPAPEVQPPPEVQPDPADEALRHLDRAQALEASGDLAEAEAEAAVAISLQPQDPAPYLARARIRMKMADAHTDRDDASQRRARAALLRQAAEDVGDYLQHAEASAESRVYLETRQQGLLREAEALDPQSEPEPEPEPQFVPRPPPPTEPEPESGRHDTDPRTRSRAFIGTGAALGAAAAGLAAASLQIERECSADSLCSARWQTRPAFLAPATVVAAMGSASLAYGLATAPGLADERVRRTTTITTLTLGSIALGLGTATGTIAGLRWSGSAIPSDSEGLRTTQALGNTAATSLAIALPLLTSGLTAWLSHLGPSRSASRRSRRTASR